MPDAMPLGHPKTPRQRWMAVLARADAGALQARLGDVPRYTVLRGPEAGLVMVRGRAGGGGAPFNLGEMTATRCTVRTDTGLVGHAYVAGRNERLAELAAVVGHVPTVQWTHSRKRVCRRPTPRCQGAPSRCRKPGLVAL